jgi:PST family polysaccharide transporter
MTVVSSTCAVGRILPAAPRAEELHHHAVRGGVFTVGAQAARFLIQLGATAVLARLLTPADYGLVAMVTAVTGFVTLFKDLGLSTATVQRQDLTHEQVNALFWLNVAAAAALMLVAAALAPVIGWFYGEPRAVTVTLALSGCFLFGGVTAQHRALLRRNMRFGALSIGDIASMAVGMSVAIVLAWRGAQYWALVASIAAREITQLAFQWAQSGWRPGRPAGARGLRPMIVFGANLTGFNVVNYLLRNVDNLLIGRAFGAAALGLYSKAYGLLLMPIQQVTMPIAGVVLPALCRLQDRPAQYRTFYLKGVMLIVLFSMPLAAATLVLADSVVLTLLGPAWMEVVPIFRVLGVAALVDTLNSAPGWAFVSLNRTGRQFRWQLFETGLTVAAFVIGLRWGPIGVAAGFSIVRCALRVPVLRYALHGSPVRLHDLFGAVWRPAAASAMAAGPVYAAHGLLAASGTPAAVQLVAGLAAFGALYLAAYLLLPGGREEIRGLGRVVDSFRGVKSSKPDATKSTGDDDISGAGRVEVIAAEGAR